MVINGLDLVLFFFCYAIGGLPVAPHAEIAFGRLRENDACFFLKISHLDFVILKPLVVVLDASWYMPHEQRNPLQEYQVAHILGSLFFDMNEISDRTTNVGPIMFQTKYQPHHVRTLEQIHSEQCSEVELEKRLRDLARTKLNADEKMCCDLCRIPVIDYHRHCTNYSYDLCLSCCKDVREDTMILTRAKDFGLEGLMHYGSTKTKQSCFK